MAIELIDIEKRLVELNTEIARLTFERDELLKDRDAYLTDIKEYDNFDDIEWELVPLTAATSFLSKWLGNRVKKYKPVLVNGKLYQRWTANKFSKGQRIPDWIMIGTYGCVDVTKDIWIIDGGLPATGLADQIERVRNYTGGLNQDLSTWDATPEGSALKAAYLDSH